jgi:hypothetical protein
MRYAYFISSKIFVLSFVVAVIFSYPLFLFAETTVPTVTVIYVECNDGVDNDGDTLTDFPNDPGCAGFGDNDETDPQCVDGLDNDADGLVDYPADPGCDSANDNDETDPAVPTPSQGNITGFELPKHIERVKFIGLAQPNAYVTLLRDGVIAEVGNANEKGVFEIQIFNVTPGQYIFSLYSLDTRSIRSGILSFSVNLSSSINIDISNIFIPPTVRVVPSLGTKTATIEGSSIPNSIVKIVLRDDEDKKNEITVTTNGKGFYSHTLNVKTLGDGEYLTKTFSLALGLESPFGQAIGFFIKDGILRIIGDDALVGDFNGDGKINLVDFSMIAFWHGRPSPPSRFDLNSDGKVNLIDFSIMAFYWTG